MYWGVTLFISYTFHFYTLFYKSDLGHNYFPNPEELHFSFLTLYFVTFFIVYFSLFTLSLVKLLTFYIFQYKPDLGHSNCATITFQPRQGSSHEHHQSGYLDPAVSPVLFLMSIPFIFLISWPFIFLISLPMHFFIQLVYYKQSVSIQQVYY